MFIMKRSPLVDNTNSTLQTKIINALVAMDSDDVLCIEASTAPAQIGNNVVTRCRANGINVSYRKFEGNIYFFVAN